MRLKQLKLAGFKSFVDPTPIPFPSQLVAVVGPNGCGKSNIMDSVRWVMGESSAKNLRSESMADVIFNGSTNRKPIGQASVELIFENDKGRLSGQYANFQEVSIKRLVTRAGDSSYFLNGTRCRRRDINDLFLGTGAGARGYAIIGQDMISRLIEARPEELRAYLEEAAGVSKYKERRRETCHRIKHTQENIERVNDIIEEMGKQLEKLERQAKTAEKYKNLKEQERSHQVNLLALKWLDYDKIKSSTILSIQNNNTAKNEVLTQITYLEKETQLEQHVLFDVDIQLNEIQEKYYVLGREITRLETTLEQQRKERKRLIAELDSLDDEYQNLHTILHKDQCVVEEQAETLGRLESQKKEMTSQLECLSVKVRDKESSMRQEQEQWRQFNNEKQQIAHALEKKLLQEEHLVSRHQDVMIQLEQTDIDDLKSIIEVEEALLKQLSINLQDIQKEYNTLEETRNGDIQRLKNLKQSLTDEQSQLQKANTEHHTLQTEYASEKAALDVSSQISCAEFKKSQWHTYPRLFDALEVEKGWEKTVEWVLGEGIEAVVIESLEIFKNESSIFNPLTASFVTSTDIQYKQKPKGTLSCKLNGLIPNWLTHLNEVFIADNHSEAMEMLDSLKPHQSVVTQQGFWVGQGWLKIKNFNQENKPGILKRKNNIQRLEAKLYKNKQLIEKIESGCDKKIQQINEAQLKIDEVQNKLMSQHRELTEIRANTNQLKLKIDDKTTSLEKAKDHYDLLTTRLEELIEEKQLLSEEINKIKTKLESYQSQEKDKQDRLSVIEDDYQQLKGQLLQFNEKKQAHDLLTQKEKFQYVQLKERIVQNKEQLARLNEKKIKIEKQLVEDDSSDEMLSKPLEENHNLYLELEQKIQVLKNKSQDVQEKINAYQEKLRQKEKKRDALNELQQSLQIELQTTEVNLTNLKESLRGYHQNPESVVDALPPEISQNILQQELEHIQDRIKRLGAINLVAIEEYQESKSRKKHLDDQHADLTEALNILGKAIHKMDKETESRFKATFEEVNASFQRLFPKLFGGGRAKLNLTCDNLLEAGVVVTAQPPGKKNSTIYMLSGGEKSMTAIALVFSIFQLNPAPFCLLDEVDAPLDEANVRRFCNMVKEMSEYVQFLFITHNKVTMELAEQLIGVTMREPGVSRIVAVDMEEALGYAQT